MSRYLPAKVRRIIDVDRNGRKTSLYVITCAEHGAIAGRETHNGAHMAKAAHNRRPHSPPPVRVKLRVNAKPALRALNRVRRAAESVTS